MVLRRKTLSANFSIGDALSVSANTSSIKFGTDINVSNVEVSTTITTGSDTLTTVNQPPDISLPPYATDVKGYWTTQVSSSYSDLSSWVNTSSDVGGTGSTDATMSSVTLVADQIGQSTTYPALQGTTSSTIAFGSDSSVSSSDNYTTIHLTRYIGPTKERIIQGTGANYLIGHWNNTTGVAFHNGWVPSSRPNQGYDTNWFIGVARHNHYRTNGTTRGSSGAGSYTATMSINSGNYPAESSNFQIALLLIYNRRLSDSEVAEVETWVNQEFDLQITLGT